LFASATFSTFRFKAGETLAHVRKESRLSLLAVGHNVDAALGLLTDNPATALWTCWLKALSSYGSLLTLAFIRSSKSLGRAKLPQWVVRIRSVLRFMVLLPLS